MFNHEWKNSVINSLNNSLNKISTRLFGEEGKSCLNLYNYSDSVAAYGLLGRLSYKIKNNTDEITKLKAIVESLTNKPKRKTTKK